MPIDKPYFYKRIREVKLFDKLNQAQVDSIDAILNECDKQGLSLKQSAYVFATAYHEAYNPKHPDSRITPIKEFGGIEYLQGKKYYPYYGRGFSQLTWDYNYKKEGERLGIDLLKNPDMILDDIPMCANSHVYCMAHGRYTGKKLSDYINDTKTDYIGARKIVNGKDQAQKIAGYAQSFEACLKES